MLLKNAVQPTYAVVELSACVLAVYINIDDFGAFASEQQWADRFVEAMVASSITGALFVPIDPRTKGEKLAFMLSNSGCKGLVTADYSLEEVARVRRCATSTAPTSTSATCPRSWAPTAPSIASTWALRTFSMSRASATIRLCTWVMDAL